MTASTTPLPPSIGDAPWLRAPATQKVFASLIDAGYTARAVGGCVRNSLLARHPVPGQPAAPAVTDIDIATTAAPQTTIELAEASGLRAVPTGLEHGTVTVIANHQGFEVTTLRRDVATDGRRAEVEFTDDWALDAARRDFTMNALYADRDGTIFDPLHGYPDLRDRRIRFVGDAASRIREDYLRILRFFRFYAQYGHDRPDAEGIHAAIAERAGLRQLSAERIRQELVKLLVAPGAVAAVREMASHGLLGEILPIAPNLSRFARLAAIDCPPDAALRLATLTVNVTEDAARLAPRLRLSRHEADTLELVARALADGTTMDAPPAAAAARLLLYRHGAADYVRLIRFYWSQSAQTENSDAWAKCVSLPNLWAPPQFPLTGRQLIAIGAKPGPALGDVLKDLEKQWLASDFRLTADELFERARRTFN